MIGVDKIDDIRRLGRNGATVASIARDTGVSEPTVRKYLREPDLSERPPAVGRAPESPLLVNLIQIQIHADYGVETARDAIEVLFRLEEGFGARPEADDGGARVAVDPAAPGAQKLDAAVRAWAAMRARRDSGEISEEEYLDWKRGFAGG